MPPKKSQKTDKVAWGPLESYFAANKYTRDWQNDEIPVPKKDTVVQLGWLPGRALFFKIFTCNKFDDLKTFL